MCEERVVREDGSKLVDWGSRENGWAGCGACRGHALYLELGESVHKARMCHVYKKVKMGEKVSTYNWLFNVCENEHLRRRPRSRVRERVPYVAIGELFTACRVKLSQGRLRSV